MDIPNPAYPFILIILIQAIPWQSSWVPGVRGLDTAIPVGYIWRIR